MKIVHKVIKHQIYAENVIRQWKYRKLWSLNTMATAGFRPEAE